MKIGMIVAGAVLGVLALGALGLGAGAPRAEGEKDDKGYFTTDSERFGAGTRALATDNVDLSLDGAEWLVDSGDFGKVELDVASERERPVFVGIARTEDVDSLSARGGPHARDRRGRRSARPRGLVVPPRAGQPPAGRPGAAGVLGRFGAGSRHSALDWRVTDGDWSIVVMNADGSRGVAADVSAGAQVPFLDELGWSAVGAGSALMIGAVALIVLGIRPPRNRPPHVQVGDIAPAAS